MLTFFISLRPIDEWNIHGHLSRRRRLYHPRLSTDRSPAREEKTGSPASAKEQEEKVKAPRVQLALASESEGLFKMTHRSAAASSLTSGLYMP